MMILELAAFIVIVVAFYAGYKVGRWVQREVI